MNKRLFFGIEIDSPWPEDLPQGRLLDEKHRHLTLAFLGNVYFPKLEEALLEFPIPKFKVGFVAKFDQCLFLPPKSPHVVAWHLQCVSRPNELKEYQRILIHWLQFKGFTPNTQHDFLPHITLARSPFDQQSWREQFYPLPAVLHTLHLYESVGNLTYLPLWSFPILPPFEEIEHTADIAYLVRGENFDELFLHATAALCFNFPALLSFVFFKSDFNTLEDVIIELNHIVSQADAEIGCPFKAVSFHHQLHIVNSIMQWEMIIDV